MIKSLSIENYRGLHNTSVSPLARVNLVTGPNSVSKTAFLEACWIFHGRRNPRLWWNQNVLRGWVPRDGNPLHALGTEGKPIRFVEKGPGKLVNEISIEVRRSSYLSVVSRIQGGGREGEAAPEVIGSSAITSGSPSAMSEVLPSGPGTSGSSQNLWGRLEDGVHKPLAQLGGGLVKLFLLYVDLFEARDGMVAIDEIENGVHHAALSKMWGGIAAFASKNTVQVFAATHSAECIQAACEVFAEAKKDEFVLHRLYRSGDRILSEPYQGEKLEAAIEAGFEIR